VSDVIEISRTDARKLALGAQQLPRSSFARGLAGTREAIEYLGYVQIDTISVVERAHHHTLWNRVPHYRRRYLDRLVRDRSVFEYWSHAAAYLPMYDYRFCLPRMRAIASGQRHWYGRNQKLMNDVLARIRAEGPLQAGDFEAHKGNAGGMWEWGPVKQAIEYLFMEGELLVTRRESFAKVFDLAERVLPADIDTSTPSTGEYAHYLIGGFLRAHGIARETEFGYLRKGMGAAIKDALAECVESGAALPVGIRGSGERYYTSADYEQILARRMARGTARILSPFDNLVIQRKRVLDLFGFDYQVECYVPEPDRKFGYFCLPIVWQGKLVARMDCKAERKSGCFTVRTLVLEPHVRRFDEFAHRLSGELRRFAQFNDCDEISVQRVAPAEFKALLQRAFD
jgi:uncharacterized protein YcaQ